MDVFERIFGRSSSSASVAKKRLQVILTQDRTDISLETLNVLKDEIVSAISRHIEIEAANVEVTISNDAEGYRLTANIPVVSTRTVRVRTAGARAPRRT